MADAGAQVWGGKDGSQARAGMGAAYIIENQSSQHYSNFLDRVEQDRRKIEQQEKRRVLYGQASNIELEGWDVDVQRQLGGRLNDNFIKSMSVGLNPLDPQNQKEFGEYSALVSSLQADMLSSEGQKELYTKQPLLVK